MVQADQQILENSQGKGGIKFLFVFEIKIEGSRTQLSLLGDVLHGGFVESLVGKYPFGGHNDLLSSAFAFSFFAFLYSHDASNPEYWLNEFLTYIEY
jgi:hypothetical protein